MHDVRGARDNDAAATEAFPTPAAVLATLGPRGLCWALFRTLQSASPDASAAMATTLMEAMAPCVRPSRLAALRACAPHTHGAEVVSALDRTRDVLAGVCDVAAMLAQLVAHAVLFLLLAVGLGAEAIERYAGLLAAHCFL